MSIPSLSDKAYRWLLLVIVVLAWGLRLYIVNRFVGLSSTLDPADGLDEQDYEEFAYQMSIGNGYVLADGTPTARRSPGTSLTLLPVYLLLGRSVLAARVWMCFLSAWNCAAAAWVIRRSAGNGVALITAAAMAVNPGLFYYATHLWSEAPYCLAITLALGCLLRGWETGQSRWIISAGVCWAATILLRPQILLLAPCVLCAAPFVDRASLRRWGIQLLVQSLVVTALVSPWLIRNKLVMGSYTLNTLVGGHTFWGAHTSKTFEDPQYLGFWKPYQQDPGIVFPLTGDEVEQDRQAWRNGWVHIRNHPDQVPRLLLWKLYRLVTPFEETANRMVYWAFALTWIVSAPFAAWGMVRLRSIDRNLFWWIVFNWGAILISTLIFYGAARFRHGMEPFTMMAAALGACSLIIPVSPPQRSEDAVS